MDRIRRSIGRAQCLRELLPLIVLLSRKTEAMMNSRGLSEADIQRIAVPLAKIRSLLSELAPLGTGQDGPSDEEAHVRALADRYREMEGRIKEMRNDRARARKLGDP